MPAVPLTEWLRGQDDQLLADLLRARPDLATPPPADLAVLAARAGSRASVSRAAEGLDTFTLAVLDALVVADADREPVTRAEVEALVGPGAPASRVRAALDQLSRLALAWGPPEELSVVPAAREAGGLYPAGLGQPSAALVDVDVAQVVAGLAEADRRLLTALAHGSSPVGRTRDAAVVVPLERAQTPVQRLLAMGLLLRRDAENVELPRQVGLALRGDSPLGTVRLDEPVPREVSHSNVDATGAGEVLEILRRTEKLIELWSEEPATVLKAGGLGVRDVRRLARELDTDDRGASFVVELAFGAGMIADSATATNPEWMPTTVVDPWLVASPANRWATLAAAWLDLPRLPGLAGLRDAKDKVLAPLSDDLRRAPAPAERRRVLAALAELPPGAGIADPDELAEVLAWRAPRRGGRLRDEIVRWTLHEATALGVVALGAITTAGRTLLADGPAQAAKAMAESMPEPVDHVLVQADLTVVAPGPLEPTLAVDMAQVADVESAGSATVYRVTEQSVRRALDAGRSAQDLHELFTTKSRTPVPQGLTYLIDDVARRHGRLRGGPAACFLRCDDPVLLAEVAAHPLAARLELRRIAPTVVVSPLPLADVLDELRGAGFAPAAEGADGQVIDLRQTGHRLPATQSARARRAGLPNPPSIERLRDIVAQVRASDTAAATRRGRTVSLTSGGGVADTSATLALLREAIERNGHVLIDFVDARGVASQRVVTPFRVGGGVLEGRDVVDQVGDQAGDQASETVRQYPLHRITSASLIATN